MLKFAVALLAVSISTVLIGCGPVFTATPGDDGPVTSEGVIEPTPADTAPPPVADAGAEAAPDTSTAAACVTDLSKVGSGDFHIAFTIVTQATGKQLALLSQRVGCDDTSAYWAVTLSQGGGIVAVTNDGTPTGRFFVEAGNGVNDGIPHRVLVARVNGQLSLSRDGIVDSMLTPDPTVFDVLPALAVGTDACSTDIALEGNGSITDLCITH